MPLNGMPQGMTEIQQHALSRVKFILGYDVPLDGDTPGNDLVRLGQNIVTVVGIQQGKQPRIPDHTIFDRFCDAIAENMCRQGFQRVRIADHQAGLLECPHQVLASGDVDGSFSTYGGVNLRQQSGGNLNVPNAPQEGGSRKAGEIPHNAAA